MPRGLRLAEAALLTAALALSLVCVLGPPDLTLDPSWQAMLIHAHASGLQFGREVIFTWGPWGYLFSLTHLGRLEAVPILVWQIGGQALVAAALVYLTRMLPPWRRWAFAAALVLFHWLFLDTPYLVLITLVAVCALMRRGGRAWPLAAWAAALGFLSEVKFTYLVVSCAGVGASFCFWWLAGRRGRSALVAAAFAAAIAGWWVGAGQNLDNLYPFFLRGLEISSGYADAMALDESWTVFLWGASLAAAYGYFLWRAWSGLQDRPFACCATPFLAFAGFVVWKEGYVRADYAMFGGHVFGLFTYLLVLAPVVSWLLVSSGRWSWFDLAAPACLAAIASFDPGFYAGAPRILWQITYGNWMAVTHAAGLPGRWEQALASAKERAALPRIDAAVGRSSVDVLGYSVGAALLNDMKLSTRPVFQSYTAYTPSLEGWNLRYYQSGRAPDFILWKDERIDNRYPGQDDAMLVAALPGRYEPVLEEEGYSLLRRTGAGKLAVPARRLLFTRTVRLGEEVDLPAPLESAIWLTADPVPDMLGRFRSALYKPARIDIVTRDGRGRPAEWRLLPRVARAGFILVPTLLGADALGRLEKGRARDPVRSFHFWAPDGQDEFWSRVSVAVFSVPSLPLREVDDE